MFDYSCLILESKVSNHIYSKKSKKGKKCKGNQKLRQKKKYNRGNDKCYVDPNRFDSVTIIQKHKKPVPPSLEEMYCRIQNEEHSNKPIKEQISLENEFFDKVNTHEGWKILENNLTLANLSNIVEELGTVKRWIDWVRKSRTLPNWRKILGSSNKHFHFFEECNDFSLLVDKLNQWETVQHFLTMDAWYENNDEIVWADMNTTPKLVKPWVEYVKENKEIVNQFLEFLPPEETTKGGNKPDALAERISGSYFHDGECYECTKCHEEHWHSFHIDVAGNCGKVCRQCVHDTLKERLSGKIQKSNPLMGATYEGPKNFGICPHEGCNKCRIQFRPRHWLYLTRELDLSREKLITYLDGGVEADIRSKLLGLDIEFKKPFDLADEQRSNTELNAARNLIETVYGNEIKNRLQTLCRKVELSYRHYEAQYNVRNLKKICTEIDTKRIEKDFDGMYEALEKISPFYKQSLSYRNSISDKPICGIEPKDWIDIILEMARGKIELATNASKRCGVCFDIQSSPESTIKFMHLPNEPQPIVPCMVCVTCCDKSLDSAADMSQPELLCPCMGCRRRLNANHILEIAPIAYGNYSSRLLKYKLKQVENFKFCPNPQCGQGFVVYEKCGASNLTCPGCSFDFCSSCYGRPHQHIGDGSCLANYKHQHTEVWANAEITNEEDEKQQEIVFTETDTKQCPFCLVWIEKNGGCQHMTCHHCKGEFCWICNGRWCGHTTCDSPIKISRKYFYETVPKENSEEDEEDSEETVFDEELMDPYYREYLENMRKPFVPELEPKISSKKTHFLGCDDGKDNYAYQHFLLTFNDSENESSSEEESDFFSTFHYNNFLSKFTEDDVDSEESESEFINLFDFSSDESESESS